jgi:hypothetical protein
LQTHSTYTDVFAIYNNFFNIIFLKKMKQVLFLTLICAFSTVAKAQKNPLKIGFFINPAYSDRFKEKDFFFQGIFIGQYAYSLGLFAQTKIAPSLDFRFGASLVNNGERTKRESRWGFQNGNVFFPALSNESFVLIENYYNIELPIDIQWFMNKKRTFFTVFGASPGYNYLKTMTTKNYLDDRFVSSNAFEASNDQGISVALEVGMGYRMRLNESLWFEIQPKFRTYITPAQSTYNMYNVGLQLNIIY